MKRAGRTRNCGLGGLGAIAALGLLVLSHSCGKTVEFSGPPDKTWCEFSMARGNTAEGLGMSDWNAGYNGFVAPVRRGEKVIVRGKFPHARYASFTVYDQDFMFADKLTDEELGAVSGVNPFLPGVDRSRTGEFEIQILMDARPAGKRPVNTLYAGLSNKGKPNKLFVFGYRVYLADKGYGFRDQHPLAATGGVEPPRFQIIDRNGNAYCPDRATVRRYFSRTQMSIMWSNRGKLFRPFKGMGRPESPPAWFNNASAETQRANTYVGNDDTAYIAALVSNKLGEILVLRFKPPLTPEQTYLGRPFPESYDMRYWSIAFAYIDHSRPLVVYSEKTVTDVDAPRLPDGSWQVVVGLGGIARPSSVPAGQWVSLNMKEGILIMRNILIRPEYSGDFFKLPPGRISAEFDRYTPGGVYCSAREFAQNPDIGLQRPGLVAERNK